MKKQEICERRRDTGSLLEEISACLACQYLSDLHDEYHRDLASRLLAHGKERYRSFYGERAYREALAYVRSGAGTESV